MRLSTKLAILALSGVVALGVLVGVVTTTLVDASMRADLRTRGVLASKQLALTVASDVIGNRPLAVRQLLEGFKESDSQLRYLYVIGLDGEIVAHTFNGGFPAALAAANPLGAGATVRSKEMRTAGEPVIDVGYRLLLGSPAAVHVGMSEQTADAAISQLRQQVALVTLLVAVATGVGVVMVSALFTKPLENLASAASVFEHTSEFRAVPVESKDEVGKLTETFNAMGASLDLQIRTTNAAIEELERNRGHLEEIVSARTSELEKSNRELQEATETKSRFLANMSHELRTPLNSIIGFSGLMLGGMAGELNDEQRHQLEMVNRSGIHLLEIINDVLDLSKIEAGQVTAAPTVFDLADLVHETVEIVRPLASGKELDITVDWRADISVVECDERMVRQILLNLVGNAVKFTDAGFVRLEVERDGERDMVLQVVDSGPGMLDAEIRIAFDEFTQLSTPRAGKPAGTGLGLPVSQRLATLLGGSIDVESIPGTGSTFTLHLPCLPITGPPDAAEA